MRRKIFVSLFSLLLASQLQANIFRVTLAEGPDQPEENAYTFAGAIDAANASEGPAEIIIEIVSLSLDAPLEIQHQVTIVGPEWNTARLNSTVASGPVIRFAPGAAGSEMRHISLGNRLLFEGEPLGDVSGISVCVDSLVMEKVFIAGFAKGIEIDCDEPVSISLSGPANMQLNLRDVVGELLPGSSVVLDDMHFLPEVGGFDLYARDCGASFMVRDSFLRHENFAREEDYGGRVDHYAAELSYEGAMIRLSGCIDARFESTAFQGRSPFLDVQPIAVEGNEQRATVEFINSSIHRALHYEDAPLIRFDGEEFRLRHSSIVANTAPDDAPCLSLVAGEMLLDHSIVAANRCSSDVKVSGGELEGSYSLLGSVEDSGGFSSLDAVSASLLGQNPLLDTSWRYPELRSGSPAINAGNPAFAPGVDDIPEADLRGSARLTGAAMDLGAIEFNRRPEFLEREFFRDLRRKVADADDDEVIVMYLMDYITDPDGHQVTILQASLWDPWVTFDSSTNTLSGRRAGFRDNLLELALEDELGLVAWVEVRFADAWRGRGSGNSSGGLLSMAWLGTLLLLAGRRQRSSKRLTSIV